MMGAKRRNERRTDVLARRARNAAAKTGSMEPIIRCIAKEIARHPEIYRRPAYIPSHRLETVPIFLGGEDEP